MLVEKTTHGNVGTNGETDFHHTAMKMIPDSNGVSIDFSIDPHQEFSFTTHLLDTKIEEFDDLHIVAWVQDERTKYILQSASSDLNFVINTESPQVDENQLFLSPNPAYKIVGVTAVCRHRHWPPQTSDDDNKRF